MHPEERPPSRDALPASAESISARSALPRAARFPLTLIIVSLLLLGALPIRGDRYLDVYRADVNEQLYENTVTAAARARAQRATSACSNNIA